MAKHIPTPAALFLAVKLRELRQMKGLTQQTMAQMIGLQYKYYQEMESARKLNPRLDTLEKLACALGISLGELFEGYPPDLKPAKKQTDSSQPTKCLNPRLRSGPGGSTSGAKRKAHKQPLE